MQYIKKIIKEVIKEYLSTIDISLMIKQELNENILPLVIQWVKANTPKIDDEIKRVIWLWDNYWNFSTIFSRMLRYAIVDFLKWNPYTFQQIDDMKDKKIEDLMNASFNKIFLEEKEKERMNDLIKISLIKKKKKKKIWLLK